VVIAVWFSLQFFLATKYPLDVVPSCSMLPSLQRGDMLLLQGIKAPPS
jgi:signal peptidase I